MDHAHHVVDATPKGIRAYAPLFVIFTLIIGFTTLRNWEKSFDISSIMNDFMAGFFLLFGAFKIRKWKDFAEAYASYDILARRSRVYALAYPLIEIALGLTYFFWLATPATHVITLILMSISSIGVLQALIQKRKIHCACLGTVFNLPMSNVTLFEDLLMAAMAAAMLFLK